MLISNQKTALNIKISESILTKVSTVKFLGVTFNENLTLKDHLNKVTVTSKISKSVRYLESHEETPLLVACKRNGGNVLFFGVFISDLCFTRKGRSGRTICC